MKQLLYLQPFAKEMQLLLLEQPIHAEHNKTRVVMSHGLAHILYQTPLKS